MLNYSIESVKVVLHEHNGCLVVPIQEELSIDAARKIQEKVLARLQSKLVHGVIIDLSGVEIIDSALWEVFVKTARMVKMMGSRAVISGLNPGIVAAIIDLNLDTSEVRTDRDVESAMQYLQTHYTPAGE